MDLRHKTSEMLIHYIETDICLFQMPSARMDDHPKSKIRDRDLDYPKLTLKRPGVAQCADT
jgi:hypothetical protein